ncbi:hypothetical protein F4X86_04500 [Candidatus Saccharibacteria bacterium]|nr:hypothetical protein [Candidatus Saccharibacteria bacterium]
MVRLVEAVFRQDLIDVPREVVPIGALDGPADLAWWGAGLGEADRENCMGDWPDQTMGVFDAAIHSDGAFVIEVVP